MYSGIMDGPLKALSFPVQQWMEGLAAFVMAAAGNQEGLLAVVRDAGEGHSWGTSQSLSGPLGTLPFLLLYLQQGWHT